MRRKTPLVSGIFQHKQLLEYFIAESEYMQPKIEKIAQNGVGIRRDFYSLEDIHY
jgi:hypothetical protein